MQKKDVLTINDSVYFKSDEQVDTISYSNKQVDTSSDPKEETHISNIIHKWSVRQLFEPAVIGVIGQDLITNVQENSRVYLSLKSLSLLNTITPKAIVTGAACKSAQVDRNTRKTCTPDDRNIWNHIRVGTLEVNEGVFSPSRGRNPSLTKWSRNIEPLDTPVDRSATKERNSDFLCIGKAGVKSLPNKIVADLDLSTRVKLVNSVLSKIPKFKNLGILTFDATSKKHTDFAPSNRS